MWDYTDVYLMFSPAIETETGEKAAKEEAVVENTTPDYAAGLVSAQVPCSHITRTFMFLWFCLIFPSRFLFPNLFFCLHHSK